jgi:hypothetical protein
VGVCEVSDVTGYGNDGHDNNDHGRGDESRETRWPPGAKSGRP